MATRASVSTATPVERDRVNHGLGLRLSPHTEATGRFRARSRVPIHQAPSAGNLLLADPEHPNTWYLAGTHRLEPSVAIGSRPEIIRADRQHAASARARVRDRSHNARLVQGRVVVREDQGDHQANELTRRAIATSRSIRSEGLGLALAEAMMLSKPSIATAYSGNLDFMDESNSLLVGYDLTEIETTAGPYEKGNSWAEPSIPEAANAMHGFSIILRRHDCSASALA